MREPVCHERECLPIRARRACATDASSSTIASTDEPALHCVKVNQICECRDSSAYDGSRCKRSRPSIEYLRTEAENGTVAFVPCWPCNRGRRGSVSGGTGLWDLAPLPLPGKGKGSLTWRRSTGARASKLDSAIRCRSRSGEASDVKLCPGDTGLSLDGVGHSPVVAGRRSGDAVRRRVGALPCAAVRIVSTCHNHATRESHLVRNRICLSHTVQWILEPNQKRPKINQRDIPKRPT